MPGSFEGTSGRVTLLEWEGASGSAFSSRSKARTMNSNRNVLLACDLFSFAIYRVGQFDCRPHDPPCVYARSSPAHAFAIGVLFAPRPFMLDRLFLRSMPSSDSVAELLIPENDSNAKVRKARSNRHSPRHPEPVRVVVTPVVPSTAGSEGLRKSRKPVEK